MDWGPSRFNAVISDPTLRNASVQNLRDLAVSYNLDGIEVDTENRPPVEVYSVFLTDLSGALSPPGRMVAISAEAYRIEVSLAAANRLDFIGIMTYDLYIAHGYPYHSMYDESVEAMNLWASAGIPKTNSSWVSPPSPAMPAACGFPMNRSSTPSAQRRARTRCR